VVLTLFIKRVLVLVIKLPDAENYRLRDDVVKSRNESSRFWAPLAKKEAGCVLCCYAVGPATEKTWL
jgi:hypothetical protein